MNGDIEGYHPRRNGATMDSRTATRATATQTTTAALLSQMAAATSAPISTPTATAADSSWTLSGLAGAVWDCGRLSSEAIRACRLSSVAGRVDRGAIIWRISDRTSAKACKAVWESITSVCMAWAGIARPGLSGGLDGAFVGNVSGIISGGLSFSDNSLRSCARVSPGVFSSLVNRACNVRRSLSVNLRLWPGRGW